MERTFGERLQLLMKHYSLNKNSLTVKIGLQSNSIIGRIVNEQSRPSFEVLKEILLHHKEINARWLVTNEGNMLGKETASVAEKGEIRYIKVRSGEPFPENTNELRPTALLSLYGFTDCEYAFDVFGDSMSPRFHPGDIVLCSNYLNKKILPGEAYYLVINGMPSIRVIRNIIGDMTFKLGAENPRFEDYEVKRSEVSNLYLIKGTIRREVF